MGKNGEDKLLNEIDSELRSLNKRLKDVMSEADALLSEHFGKEAQEESPESVEEAADEAVEDKKDNMEKNE